MRRPIPRWASFALLAVALLLAASLLTGPGRFSRIRHRIALRGVPRKLFRGCEVVGVKKTPYRSYSFWQELKGLRSLSVSLVDRTHSDLGVVYSLPSVGVYMGERIQEVWVAGWGELDEPVESIIEKMESNDMISEFVRLTGTEHAAFDNRGVVFSHGEYELVYAPPGIHGLEEKRGIYSCRVPNREYQSFEGVLELQRAADQAGFPIPSDATIIYGRYGGWFVKWNPENCGKDTMMVYKPREGKPNTRWITYPNEMDVSLVEPSVRARLAQMGLSREYVLSNFRLLGKKGVRQANYVCENGEVVNRTKVIGRFTYRWVTGTPWVDTLAGGCKVHAFFACRVDRPDSLYLRVGPSALESSTEAKLHKIGRLISYETALKKLPQFEDQRERFFVKIYPNGNMGGKGMIFLCGWVRSLDLESGEVTAGGSGTWCMIPEEIRQFGPVAEKGSGL